MIGFSSSTIVPIDKSTARDTCYSYGLAQAIPQNKEKIYDFIDSLQAEGKSALSPKTVSLFEIALSYKLSESIHLTKNMADQKSML